MNSVSISGELVTVPKMHLLGLVATAATYLLLPSAAAASLPFEDAQLHETDNVATAVRDSLLPNAAADTLPFGQTLPFEDIQLRESDIASLGEASSLFSFGDAPGADPATSRRRAPPTGCKVFPGDAKWPSDKDWSTLNDTLNGALIRTIPLAAPCYAGPNYVSRHQRIGSRMLIDTDTDAIQDANRCSYVTANWANSTLQ